MPPNPDKPRCVLCGVEPTMRRSRIGDACRAALTAGGRAWCPAGNGHIVLASEIVKGGRCRECARGHNRLQTQRRTAIERAAKAQRLETVGTCGTCGAPLATHARCGGCTRLLHGDAAKEPLCSLCARDRAAGVPPQGYSWRELEVAA